MADKPRKDSKTLNTVDRPITDQEYITGLKKAKNQKIRGLDEINKFLWSFERATMLFNETIEEAQEEWVTEKPRYTQGQIIHDSS